MLYPDLAARTCGFIGVLGALIILGMWDDPEFLITPQPSYAPLELQITSVEQLTAEPTSKQPQTLQQPEPQIESKATAPAPQPEQHPAPEIEQASALEPEPEQTPTPEPEPEPTTTTEAPAPKESAPPPSQPQPSPKPLIQPEDMAMTTDLSKLEKAHELPEKIEPEPQVKPKPKAAKPKAQSKKPEPMQPRKEVQKPAPAPVQRTTTNRRAQAALKPNSTTSTTAAATSAAAATTNVQSAVAQQRLQSQVANLLVQEIKRKLRYPRNAVRRKLEGVVQVEFSVQQGRITHFRLLKGSGHKILDDAAAKLASGMLHMSLPVNAAQTVVVVPIKYELL